MQTQAAVSAAAPAVPEPAELLARARALAPILRQRSAAAEKARQCPAETIADIKAAGIPRTVQPQRYGGYGMDWDVLCEIAMELGAGCGAQGWTATVLADHPCLAAMFPQQAQDEVWGEDSSTLVSTSYNPRGTVQKVHGGYILNGRWMYSSGVSYADWTIVGGFVDLPDGRRQHHFFLVPASDRTIVDDWDAMGMAGTGSMSVELKDAFVPGHRALDARLVASGQTPGAALHPEPLHRMPIIGFTGSVLVSVPVGVAMGMVRDFETMLRERFGSGPAKPGLEDMQGRAAEAGAEVEAARLLILETGRRNMAKLRAGHLLDESDAATTARNSAYAAKLAKQAATRLFEVTGGSGLGNANHFQRSFRDVYAGTAHGTLNWGRSANRYGAHILGWPPELPF
ncbi:MAG: acyl-CoA dehydrogenase family protein [Beijerinckiaceae bacterium]